MVVVVIITVVISVDVVENVVIITVVKSSVDVVEGVVVVALKQELGCVLASCLIQVK